MGITQGCSEEVCCESVLQVVEAMLSWFFFFVLLELACKFRQLVWVPNFKIFKFRSTTVMQGGALIKFRMVADFV